MTSSTQCWDYSLCCQCIIISLLFVISLGQSILFAIEYYLKEHHWSTPHIKSFKVFSSEDITPLQIKEGLIFFLFFFFCKQLLYSSLSSVQYYPFLNLKRNSFSIILEKKLGSLHSLGWFFTNLLLNQLWLKFLIIIFSMLIQILTFIINYYHDGSLEMNLNFALKKN